MRSFRLFALLLALLCTPVSAQIQGKVTSDSKIIPATVLSIPITGTVAGQTQIIAGKPNTSIYVTSVDLVPVPTSTVGFTQGSGLNCITGTTFVHAATDLGPGQTLIKGGGWGAQWALAPGNSLCIIIQTNPAPGSLSYAQF